MAIQYHAKHAALEGVVSVDEAEALQQWLRDQVLPAVHLGLCEHLHAAVLQVLLALRPKLIGVPLDHWLASALGLAPEGDPTC